MTKKIIIRAGLLLVLLALINGSSYWYVKNRTNYFKNKGFRQDKDFYSYGDIDYLFMGYSRAIQAYDTSIIQDSYIYSSSSESPPYIYYKLKYIFENTDKRFRYIILPGEYSFTSFNPNQLRTNSAYWKKYFDYTEIGEISGDRSMYLALKIKIELMPHYQYFTSRINGFATRQDFFNQKDKSKRSLADHGSEMRRFLLNDVKSKHFPGGQIATEFDLTYLKMVIDLCEQYDQKLIFVQLPLTGKYRELAEEMTVESKYSLDDIVDIMNSGEHTRVWDYMDFFGDDESYFHDYHHLNGKGRKRLSTEIARRLATLSE